MTDDALSSVLRSVRLSSGLFFRARLRAPFGVAALTGPELKQQLLPKADHAFPFHIVTSGRLWCRIDGHPIVELSAGDIIAVPDGSPHYLSDQPGRPYVRVAELQDKIDGEPPTLEYGGSGAVNEVLCGFFSMQNKLFNPLLCALPSMMVIRSTADRAVWLTATFAKPTNRWFSDDREAMRSPNV